jgi:2-methylcitrate dehydratase PrpD
MNVTTRIAAAQKLATPTKALAAFAADLRFEDLDEASRHAVKRHVLDTLSSCIAASRERVTRIAEEVMAETTAGGDVPVPGLKRRFDVYGAAYLAGAAGHGLDVDDGYRAGSVHPGSVMVPAILAHGFAHKLDGKRAMAAVAVGYEIAARLAQATHPRSRWRGFHNTPCAGVIGAAGCIGNALGLDARRIESAFALAASNASGLFTFLHGAGDIKRLHAGQAARDGMLVALLAAKGMEGAENSIEGPEGYFHAYGGGDADPAFYKDLDIFFGDDRLAVTQCYLKPHLCCRHIHPAIDGLLDIVGSEKLSPDQVAKVDVGTYAVAESHKGVGWADFCQAQMSFPFVMATALHRGQVMMEEFTDAALKDARVGADTGKFAITVDAECDADYPNLRSAKVTLHTTDGREFHRRVDEPLGATRNPLSDEALDAKVHKLSDPVIGAKRTATVIAMCRGLEDMKDLSELAEALAG